jgi:RNA polymerase sigma factor (TIGR02999 family)
MRRILIDLARRKRQVRHGGGQKRVALDELNIALPDDRARLLQVHEALDELAATDSTKALVVKLRFFVGLSNGEIADLLGLSERTVERAWTFAKAWLFATIRGQPPPEKKS